jgi:hypothetical protein
MATRKNKTTAYLDRRWHEQLKKVGSLEITSVDDTPDIIVDRVNRTIEIHTHAQPHHAKSALLPIRAKRKEARLQKLKRYISKHEKNEFIRSFYLRKITAEASHAKIWHIKASSRLSIEEKNERIHQAFDTIYPIPSEKTRETFINEFIAFVTYLKEHDLYNVRTVEHIEKLTEHAFYHVPKARVEVDFTPIVDAYEKGKGSIPDESKEYNARQVKAFFQKFLTALDIAKNAHVRIKDKYLFSVNPQTRSIRIPRLVKITRKRLTQITAHEVMVHFYRAILGRMNRDEQGRKLRLLQVGCQTNLATEEGLASYFEQNIFYDSTKYDIFNLFHFYLRIIAVHLALCSEPFDVYEKLDLLCHLQAAILGQDAADANKNRDLLIIRVYKGFIRPQQGCANGKIAQYLIGNRQIWEFIENGGKISNMFVGKVRIEELSAVQELGFSIPDSILGSETFPRTEILRMINRNL